MNAFTSNPLTIIVYASGVLFIISFLFLLRIELKLRRFLAGKNARTLEDSFKTIETDLKELKQFAKDMREYLTTVEKRLQTSIQAVEVVRYNPFKGTGSGGNNSFSTALLTEKGDGVVLTSMYARDRISIFAKPVKVFASEFELSDEEREAIDTCRKKLTAK